MAKKQKQRASATSTDPAALTAAAQAAIAQGHFRDAVTALKLVAKLDPNGPWRAPLAAAYAGRARELADKGMLKEAVAIWENRAALGPVDADATQGSPPPPAMHPEHASLLLRLGRIAALMKHLQTATPAEREQLYPRLAPRALVDETLAAQLPADDLLVRHLAPAQAALAAYCDGDDAALQAALAAIPFRSPYRDWAQLLKALQRLPTAPVEAAALLARLPANSPFAGVKRAAELALLPAPAFAEALPASTGSGLPAAGRFACLLQGWSDARIAAYDDLSRQGPAPTPEVLLRLLYRQRASLGEDWVRNRSLRLLLPGWPASGKWLKGAGAPAPDGAERLRLEAWRADLDGNLYESVQGWNKYRLHLQERQSVASARALLAGADRPDVAPLTAEQRAAHDHLLAIALCMRRGDLFGKMLEEAIPGDDPGDFDQEVAQLVEDSLVADPDDRDTHLRLIAYFRRGGLQKDARRILAQAQARWPRDLKVLTAALDQALDVQAFKKAAGLARQVLALDPINTGVRERLVEAHLAHARKQLKAKRTDLARNELVSAADWVRGAQGSEAIELMQGIVHWYEDPEGGRRALAATTARIGGLSGRVALALTLDRCGLDINKAWRQLPLAAHDSALHLRAPEASPAALRADLLSALARLRGHAELAAREDRDALSQQLQRWLKKWIEDQPWDTLSPNELEAACETLGRLGQHRARAAAATAALRARPDDPLFELHAFEGKYPPDGRRRPPYPAAETLNKAADRADANGDSRTAARIRETLAHHGYFLSPMHAPFGGIFGGLFGDPFDDDDDDDDEDFPQPTAQLPLPGFGPNAGGLPTDGLSERDMLATLIRTVGLDKALTIVGAPPQLRRELTQMAREQGEEGVIEALASILTLNGPFDDFPDEPPPRRRRR